jgi:hypothetical protein
VIKYFPSIGVSLMANSSVSMLKNQLVLLLLKLSVDSQIFAKVECFKIFFPDFILWHYTTIHRICIQK